MFDASQLAGLGVSLAASAARADAMLGTAVAKAANAVKGDAAAAAPVDTGNLRASISAQVAGLEAAVSPGAHYGIYVELGTSKMAAQPFLFPALERQAQPFIDAVGLIGGSVRLG